MRGLLPLASLAVFLVLVYVLQHADTLTRHVNALITLR